MRIYKTAQGRTSMLLAIKGLAIKKKKYIITQAFTCAAVPEAIIFAGYTPFWLDIELTTFSINIKKFELAIEKYPDNFAAIFIQHTFGLVPKYYEEIKDLAKRNKIPIIEDRCHCNFVQNHNFLINNPDNEKIAYCYSFENAKPINLGRGGVLLASKFKDEEYNKIDESLKNFKKQSFLKSILHICIAISYNFFYKTIFYWPILRIYRRMASKKLMPSNFNKFLDDFSCERIGFFQEIIISTLIKVSENTFKNSKKILLKSFFKIILHNFIFNANRFPVYVKNKKKAINYCKKKFIPAKDYFNTPIQPLKFEEYKFINYRENICKKAEIASKHIISFDKMPSKSFLNKIIN